MCNWDHMNQLYSHYPVDVRGVQKGVCHGCGSVRLSEQQMYPSGHCSRSLCQSCYNRMFNRINYGCVVCGADISHKVGLQQQNWREIKSHICDNPYCIATWARRHAIVTGAAQQVPQVRHVQPVQYSQQAQQAQALYAAYCRQKGDFDADLDLVGYNRWVEELRFKASQSVTVADYEDAEYVEIEPVPRQISPPKRPQLPAPGQRLTVEDLLREARKATSEQREPEVIKIDLTRKKER